MLLRIFFFAACHQEALEEFVGQFQIAHFLAEYAFCIHSEAIVAIVFELIGEHILHLFDEFFFAFSHVFSEHIVEEILVHFRILVHQNFMNQELEVAFNVGLFFVHIQQRSQFCEIAIGGFEGIVHHHIAQFSVHEFGFFILVFQISWR